jgi:hypothetical protein
MKLFTKIKQSFEVPMIELQKVRPRFITNDGVEHIGLEYNWAARSRLRCSVGEYIMTYITSNGYIEDNKLIMFPLSNVNEISWEILDKKSYPYKYSNRYQIFFNNEEVESK